MGIWNLALTGIKNFFGLAATPAGADKVLEVAKGIGSWIDEQQFTDQEKQEAKIQMIQEWVQWFGKTAGENTISSQARRDIAIFVIRTEFLFLFFSGILYRFDSEWAKIWLDIATKSSWGELTLGVGAFFFGTYMLRNYHEGKTKVVKAGIGG